MKLTAHPIAAMMPPATPEEQELLRASIKAHNGLRQKIIVNKRGQVVDGLNRWRAVEAVFDLELRNTDSKFVEIRALTDDEVLALVIDNNITRRHLKTAAKAFIAETLASLAPGEHSSANLQSIANIAKVFGISERSVHSARSIARTAPELIEHAKSGVIALHTAEAIAKLSPTERAKAAEAAKNGKAAPKRKHRAVSRLKPIRMLKPTKAGGHTELYGDWNNLLAVLRTLQDFDVRLRNIGSLINRHRPPRGIAMECARLLRALKRLDLQQLVSAANHAGDELSKIVKHDQSEDASEQALEESAATDASDRHDRHHHNRQA